MNLKIKWKKVFDKRYTTSSIMGTTYYTSEAGQITFCKDGYLGYGWHGHHDIKEGNRVSSCSCCKNSHNTPEDAMVCMEHGYVACRLRRK